MFEKRPFVEKMTPYNANSANEIVFYTKSFKHSLRTKKKLIDFLLKFSWSFRIQKMKGAVTGKVVDWANGETMDQMVDQFGPWDYTGLPQKL